MKKLTGEKLVEMLESDKLRELKGDVDNMVIEKVTKKISDKKMKILDDIRKGRKK
jgi:hypothetical protein